MFIPIQSSVRVTFFLPQNFEAALCKLRRKDPTIRTRTEALLRAIGAGLRSLNDRSRQER